MSDTTFRINLELAASLLIRSQVRGLLSAMKMYGNITDFREARALLGSTFFIKGADGVAVKNFKDWQDQLK